jgi:hypothetical protein
LRGRPPDQRSVDVGPGSGEPGVVAPISAINKVTRVQRCPAPLSRDISLERTPLRGSGRWLDERGDASSPGMTRISNPAP